MEAGFGLVEDQQARRTHSSGGLQWTEQAMLLHLDFEPPPATRYRDLRAGKRVGDRPMTRFNRARGMTRSRSDR